MWLQRDQPREEKKRKTWDEKGTRAPISVQSHSFTEYFTSWRNHTPSSKRRDSPTWRGPEWQKRRKALQPAWLSVHPESLRAVPLQVGEPSVVDLTIHALLRILVASLRMDEVWFGLDGPSRRDSSRPHKLSRSRISGAHWVCLLSNNCGRDNCGWKESEPGPRGLGYFRTLIFKTCPASS